MLPRLVVIDNNKGIEDLREYLVDKEYVAYDSETTGLSIRDNIVGISVCAEEDSAYYVIINDIEAVKPLLVDLQSKKLIMHNSVFDCSMAEAFFKINLIDSLHTDTMILAHLLNENRRVGLKELARTMFGEDATAEQEEMKASVLANGGLWTASQKEMYKADPQILGKYGAKDALLTLKLFYSLVPELYDQGLDKFFYEEESMPMLKGPTYQLNTTGLKVDQEALVALKKQLEAECLEAKAFIYYEINSQVKEKYPGTSKKNTFNIGSSQQLAWLLFDKYKFEFNTLTKEGKNVCKAIGLRIPYTKHAKREFIETCLANKGNEYSPVGTVNGKKVRAKKVKDPWNYIACDKITLTKVAPKYEWIRKLLEYQRKTKMLNTYIEGIEERIQYGIIRPSFLQHGTTSGRYSSRNPNFQNLPRDDKRIKAIIVARPGKTFVGADYSQLEPRVFAYFSKDERLLASFKGSDDFYSVIGMEVYDKFDCTPKKEGSDDAFGVKYKKLRDNAKVIALASTYGATANKLAGTTGKSIEDTQEDINSYFEKFPGVLKMMLESHETAKKTGEVKNLFGRPRRMPEAMKITKLFGDLPHAELPYEARNILNLSVNHRIQSTGASIVNRSAIKFYENCKLANIDCRLVVQVHDSLVIECSESDAEDVSALLQDAMENTVLLEGISLEAVPKRGKNLAEV